MKAELWKIRICEGVLDITHGGGHDILELYIPELQISFNTVRGCNCFRIHDGRYNKNAEKVAELDLDEFDEIAILGTMQQYIEIKESLQQVGKWFDDLEVVKNVKEEHKRKQKEAYKSLPRVLGESKDAPN